MPRMDGTGPMGCGPMTGRGFGLCRGANMAGYGRRFGSGFRGWPNRGYGMGMRRGYYYEPNAPMADVTDKEFLEREKEFLENQLEAINKELDNL